MAIDSGAGLLLFIFIALVVSGIVVGTGSEGYGNVDSKALGIVYPNEILPNDLLPIDSVAAGISGLARPRTSTGTTSSRPTTSFPVFPSLDSIPSLATNACPTSKIELIPLSQRRS